MLRLLLLTAVPRYWDTQGKIVYDLSSTQSLALNFIYGDSRITMDGTPEEKDALRAGRIDSSRRCGAPPERGDEDEPGSIHQEVPKRGGGRIVRLQCDRHVHFGPEPGDRRAEGLWHRALPPAETGGGLVRHGESLLVARVRPGRPHPPPRTSWYPSDFDYPVVLTVLAGKVVKGVRTWLDDAPFYLKYPSYILPFSDEMELSFKFRYQTGRPYTPYEYVTWRQVREGGVKWSAGSWVRSDEPNGARYSDYRRFDIQWLSRIYFRRWNINVFLAVQNLFNSRNVFYENLRTDGTKQVVYQFAFFPVGGVEVEFQADTGGGHH